MTLRRTLTLAALGFAVAGAAHAQTAADNRDADALAADMRILAANPVDTEALITAGELTLRMGDSTAAATFFGRAEKLDPNNPRIKAGWGSLMVRAERPGEALRRFQDAERRGLNPIKFAADRGLAYDLVGEQERAQRDYRLALRNGADDEVTRRYALSMGISGHRDEALALLDPLLKRSDRAAWRDRAFILAMNGDAGDAEKIAASMMSPGLGAGLTPFFQRLPQLNAVDRAFAVNFGELRSTPERIADARLVPALPRLGPDPYAPKVVAVATLVATPADEGRKRRKRRKDDLAPAVAMPAPAPTEVAVNAPAEMPRTRSESSSSGESRPGRVAIATPQPITAPPSPGPARVETPPPAPSPATSPAPTPSPPPSPTPTAPIVVAAATPPVATPPQPSPGIADQPSAAEAGVPEPTPTARVSEDTVLARIVASVETAPRPAPAPRRRAPAPAETKPAEARTAAVEPPKPGKAETRARGKPAPGDKTAIDKAARGKAQLVDAEEPKARGKTRTEASDDKGHGRVKEEDAPAFDKNGCPIPVKTSGRSKASAKAKLATSALGRANEARCKAATKKANADAETKGEPARVWVQVAGGANEGDLEKAWSALRAKAPDLFRGRQGWTTPLRATNRVLAGPFKSSDEAQDFVNRMAKAGLSGFVFTSSKGQKIERLGGK